MELESPDPADLSAGGVNTLFPEGALLTAISKVTVLESFLGLLVRDLGFAEFVRELLLVVMKTVKSEAGSILEIDHKNQCFFFRAMAGQSSDRLGQFVIPVGQGIVGHVAESRQPLIVNNVAENKVHLKAIQNAVGFETRNMIALPIVVRGRVYGVLELLNRLGEDDFTPEDVELLTYICETASKVIEVRLMLGWAAKHGEPKDENKKSA